MTASLRAPPVGARSLRQEREEQIVAAGSGWDLAEYPLWHGAMPMSMLAKYGGPEKLLVRGDGCWVEDVAGHRYFDARSGIGNVNLGYGRRDVVAAMERQARELPFACAIRFDRPAATTLAYARELVAAAPAALTRVRFTHMGSASVESALLMARLYHKNGGDSRRRVIVSLRGSFHGTTLLTMGASGDTELAELYGPMPHDLEHAPEPDPWTCAHCEPDQGCLAACVDDLAATVERTGPERVAAIIVEPVMGNRAFELPGAYLSRLRKLCDDVGALLIFDEVVTGFGRLGSLFAADHYGVTPDIMCLAKGITSGYAPMGAVLATEAVYERFDRPHPVHFPNGSSTDGHPVAAAAASAVLRALLSEGLLEAVRARGQQLAGNLAALRASHPSIRDVRGEGLLQALEIQEPDGTLAPLSRVRELWQDCEERSVLVQYTDSMLMLLPPFVASSEDIDLVTASLDDALTAVERRRVS